MKLNEKSVKKLEEAFAIGACVSEACYYADITRQTFYNWCKDNKKLKIKFDRLKEKPILKARQAIVKNLDIPQVAQWYLTKKRKEEFGDAVKLELDSIVDKDRKKLQKLDKLINELELHNQAEDKKLLQE